MKTVLFSLILASTGFAAASEQLVLTDRLGVKGGFVEKLYSDTGRADLIAQAEATLKNEGDSVYMIVEDAKYGYAVIVNVFRQGGGLIGRADNMDRFKTATAACSPARMAKEDIDYRADVCYYQSEQFILSLSYPSINYDSVEDYVKWVLNFTELERPLVSIRTKMDKNPQWKQEWTTLLNAFRTATLPLELGSALLHEKGEVKNLSEPDGWATYPTSQATPAEAKTLAGVRKLIADKKVYLTSNVPCRAAGDQDIVEAAKATGCQPMYRMGGESFENFFTALEKSGYKYDEPTRSWAK